MLNTIQYKNPLAKIRGCFFNYTQAIYRKVVKIGHQNDCVSPNGESLIKP